MDQFVIEFKKNPQKWRTLLTADQREKIQKFVNNIADVTPKTDRLALEARIIARRHPHIAVVKDDDEEDEAVPELVWPTTRIFNKLMFFKWMWINNREYMINKYMTPKYGIKYTIEVSSTQPDRIEAQQIWSKYVRSNTQLRSDISDLFYEYEGRTLQTEEVIEEEDESDSPEPVKKPAAVKSMPKKAESSDSESDELPKPMTKPAAVKPVRILTQKSKPAIRIPAKQVRFAQKAASPVRQDSEGEEIYSDEANYESDESEEVQKNNGYIPKAESESE